MITFSSIPVNPHKRGGRRLLSNPQAMHAAVRACFPPDLAEHDARVLWRVDRFGEAFTLYIVGPEAPDLDVVGDQAGWPSRPGGPLTTARCWTACDRAWNGRSGSRRTPCGVSPRPGVAEERSSPMSRWRSSRSG